jgi:hypothetical protein
MVKVKDENIVCSSCGAPWHGFTECRVLATKTAEQKQRESIIKVLDAVVNGMTYDPGHSDLDDEQPVAVWMTLGDYRRASRLKYELREIA